MATAPPHVVRQRHLVQALFVVSVLIVAALAGWLFAQ